MSGKSGRESGYSNVARLPYVPDGQDVSLLIRVLQDRMHELDVPRELAEDADAPDVRLSWNLLQRLERDLEQTVRTLVALEPVIGTASRTPDPPSVPVPPSAPVMGEAGSGVVCFCTPTLRIPACLIHGKGYAR